MSQISSKQVYYFSKSERRGIALLLGVCAMLITYKILSISGYEQPFELSVNYASVEKAEEKAIENTEEKSVQKPFPFNPNTADEASLLALGIDKKAVRSIVNYRKKGGRFKRPEDLAKIYNLPKESFDRLKPFIQLDNQRPAYVKNTFHSERNSAEFSPVPFDPNTADSATMVQSGLKSFVAKNLINYRSRGAIFRKPEDLKKIYGMDEAQWEKIADWVDIQEKESSKSEPLDSESRFEEKKFDKTKEYFTISINTASPVEWQKINGIGPGYAKRIVQFRENLGGFISVHQVAETYNLPDSVFQKILPFLSLDSAAKQIDINTATVDQLNLHPYISKKQAQLIVNYRQHHGDYVNVDVLNKIQAFDEKWIEKIRPYLAVKSENE
jgi:competence ComEA-like helix-hairpin-helix protein